MIHSVVDFRTVDLQSQVLLHFLVLLYAWNYNHNHTIQTYIVNKYEISLTIQ